MGNCITSEEPICYTVEVIYEIIPFPDVEIFINPRTNIASFRPRISTSNCVPAGP